MAFTHSHPDLPLTDVSRVNVHPCAFCGADWAASQCGACKKAGIETRYCNPGCQRSHWSTHKLSCAAKKQPATATAPDPSTQMSSAVANSPKSPPAPPRHSLANMAGLYSDADETAPRPPERARRPTAPPRPAQPQSAAPRPTLAPTAASTDSTPSDPASTASPFTSVDEFALAATELGQGNFSTVLKATYRATGARYALKRVDKQQVARLEKRHPLIKHEIFQEKHVGLLLSKHMGSFKPSAFADSSAPSPSPFDGIARLYGTFQDSVALYYCYEYCGQDDGFSELWQHTMTPVAAPSITTPLVPSPVLSMSLVQDITRRFVECLEYLYSMAIVHRDIKPENAMVSIATSDDGANANALGKLKLVDWGTSKDLVKASGTNPATAPEEGASKGGDEERAGDDINKKDDDDELPQRLKPRRRPAPPSTAKPPVNSDFVGTPEYMPPEAVDNRKAGGGKPTDCTGDLWALGCLVYQLLCGVTPFKHRSQFVILQTIQRMALPPRGSDGLPLLFFPPGLPAEARSLVQALLQGNRSERLGVVSAESSSIKAPGWFRDDAEASSSSSSLSSLPRIDFAALAAHPFFVGAVASPSPSTSLYERRLKAADALASHLCAIDGGVASSASEAWPAAALHLAAQAVAVATEGNIASILASEAGSGSPAAATAAVRAMVALTWHLLALRRRIHSPVLLTALTAMWLHPLAMLSSTSAGVSEAAKLSDRDMQEVVGAAACLRVGYCDEGSDRQGQQPCRIGQHDPREAMGWNLAPDNGAYVTRAELATHWSAWHPLKPSVGGGQGADGANNNAALWKPAFPLSRGEAMARLDGGDLETLSEVNPKGWKLIHPLEYGCQPHLSSSAIQALVAGSETAVATKDSDTSKEKEQAVPSGYYLVHISHPLIEGGADDSSSSPSCRRLQAALRAILALPSDAAGATSSADMAPRALPRAVVLSGHLTAASAADGPADSALIRKQMRLLLRCVGELFAQASGISSAAPPFPVILSGVESVDTLQALELATGEEGSENDSAALWSRCTACWLTGSRLLMLRNADVEAAAVLEPTGAAHHRQWLRDEAELNRSSAQHVLAVLRGASADPMAQSHSKRFLCASMGCRAAVEPVALTAVADSTAAPKAWVRASPIKYSPSVTAENGAEMAHCLEPIETLWLNPAPLGQCLPEGSGTLTLPILMVSQHAVKETQVTVPLAAVSGETFAEQAASQLLQFVSKDCC